MGKIIILGSEKGGVAKTTSTYNLAYCLAKEEKKVLAVDFDSQANLSTCFGIEDTGMVPVTIGHLMMNRIKDEKLPDALEYIMSRNGVDFIPSSVMLSVVDATLRLEMGAERMLAGILEPLKGRYDYILVDTCPSLGSLTINALAAADGVIITVNPQLLAMMGLQDFLKTVKKIKSRINSRLHVEGILLTMCDERTNLCKVITEQILYIDCLNADLPVLEAHPAKEDAFSMTVMGTVYTERKEAGKAIVAACRLMDDPGKEIELGEYRGFPMKLCFDGAKFKVTMKQHLTHTAELSDDVVGNITRINNALEKIPQSLERHKENMARLHKELESAKEEAERPFAQEAELLEKSARLAELNTVLDNEEKGRGGEPAREPEEDEGRGNEKPSILKSLKEYERPAPVPYGAERGQEREAI